MAYRKNEDVYLSQFLNACFLPYERKEVQRSVTIIDELEELLSYEWNKEELAALGSNGDIHQRGKSLFATLLRCIRLFICKTPRANPPFGLSLCILHIKRLLLRVLL